MSVYAPFIGILWRTIESYGVDPALVIDDRVYRSGNNRLFLERISFSDVVDILNRAVDLVKDPALGIRTAQFTHPSCFGALGHAWLVSSTLRAALNRLKRFQSMVDSKSDIQLVETSNSLRIIYQNLRPEPVQDSFGDLHQAQLLGMCRMNYGSKLFPVEANLTRTQPADPGPWLEFFGPVVKFGQDEVSLAISNEQADEFLPVSNSELAAIHDKSIQQYLATIQRNNILNRSRMCLTELLPSGRVTEDSLARELHMSSRTLHRKLREHNMTFRSLIEEVRTELSRRYIKNHNYSVTEIAFLLGYTDISAFSRAFKNWFGHSPTLARESADSTTN